MSEPISIKSTASLLLVRENKTNTVSQGTQTAGVVCLAMFCDYSFPATDIQVLRDGSPTFLSFVIRFSLLCVHSSNKGGEGG